jgi:YesN/AraC family two-component response regulator
MNTSYELTAIFLGGSVFVAGNILIGNWLKWAIMIVAYPISVWIIEATNSHSSLTLLVANRTAMLLAFAYVLIALLTLLKNRRKMIAASGQLKIAANSFYTVTEPAKKNDKIGRFLNEEKLTYFNTVINRFLLERKPFLQRKYSLRDLSVDVNISANYLSAFINRYHQMNFNDFINGYRVAQAKEMIMFGECKHKTLEAIASEAGFNNRNTFTAAFKKEAGQSPSEYLKEVKKGHYVNRTEGNEREKRLAV